MGRFASATSLFMLVLIPFFVILLLAYFLDPGSKSLRKRLLKLFFWGCLTPLPALLLEMLLIPIAQVFPPALIIPVRAFFSIAFPEELFKLITLLLVLRRRENFKTISDAAFYALAVSMGFALLENSLYMMGSESIFSFAITRSLSAIPLHALTGILMGLGLGYAKVESRSISPTFFLCVLVHGVYNSILASPFFPDWFIVPLLTVGMALSFVALRRTRKIDRAAGRMEQKF